MLARWSWRIVQEKKEAQNAKSSIERHNVSLARTVSVVQNAQPIGHVGNTGNGPRTRLDLCLLQRFTHPAQQRHMVTTDCDAQISSVDMSARQRLSYFTTEGCVLRRFLRFIRRVRCGSAGDLGLIAFTETADCVR